MYYEKNNLNNKTILVTGVAGFIGLNQVMELFIEAGIVNIVGLDSVNGVFVKACCLEQKILAEEKS